MRCGIMDQFIACHGAAGHALLLDCRSLDWRLVPIDPKARLVICNTMVHHSHAGRRVQLCAATIARRAWRSCRQALPGIKALRDVSVDAARAARRAAAAGRSIAAAATS